MQLIEIGFNGVRFFGVVGDTVLDCDAFGVEAFCVKGAEEGS